MHTKEIIRSEPDNISTSIGVNQTERNFQLSRAAMLGYEMVWHKFAARNKRHKAQMGARKSTGLRPPRQLAAEGANLRSENNETS